MRANFVLSGVATGIRRNMTMTVALVLSTAIALAAVGATYLLSTEIGRFKHDYEGRLNVSIYLCLAPPKGLPAQQDAPCRQKYTDAQMQALDQELSADPMVSGHSFVSQDEAFKRFKETSSPEIIKLTTKSDLPASFTVNLKNIQQDYTPFRVKYLHMAGVGGITNQSDTLKTLLNFIDGGRFFSIVVAIVVLVASLLLIANSVQVAAAQRKNETSIMRLVGASRWMTELPFVIETIVATFIGGMLALGLIAVGKQFVLHSIFKGPVERHVIPDLSTNDVLVAGGIGLISGIVLAALAAFLTLRLYVRL